MNSLFAILIASLVGSPHCAGMCGGFVALYSCKTNNTVKTDKQNTFSPHLCYHFGRLLTYLTLGALAGFSGQKVNNFGAIIKIQNISSLIIGTSLIAWGSYYILTLTFPRIQKIRFLNSHNVIGRKLSGMSSAIYKKIISSSANTSRSKLAFLLGFSSTFLPCGWLYTFIAIAATSGSIFGGALTMLVFWVGTVPILALIAKFSSEGTKRIFPYLPRVSAMFIVISGLFSIWSHGSLPFIKQNNAHCEHRME